MAQIVEQGAGCCGRRILTGMNGATADSIRRDMRGYIDLDPLDCNKLIEVVTSGENINRAAIEAALIEVGFQLAAEWQNCSGTLCRMFLFANDWRAYPNGAAQPIVPPAPPAPAPRPVREEPRVVSSTYHNVYRTSGRSDAGWLTLDRARAQAARMIRIDRRDVYASGAVRWVEGVNA